MTRVQRNVLVALVVAAVLYKSNGVITRPLDYALGALHQGVYAELPENKRIAVAVLAGLLAYALAHKFWK